MKLLIIDFTPCGDGTATGELKANLFEGMDDWQFMQISSPAGKTQIHYPGKTAIADATPCRSLQQVRDAVKAFSPDLVLARPTHDREGLWALTLRLWAEFDLPVLIWVMDDWLAELNRSTPQKYKLFDESLKQVFARAQGGLSICDEMSVEFERRYRVPFSAVANGISPKGEFDSLPINEPASEGPFKFRYSGSLAENMGLETLRKVATAVVHARTQHGLDVHFQIRSRKFWIDRNGKHFRRMQGVHAGAAWMTREQYLEWLNEADCGLICYNFDEDSRRYVQYSLANKLPEVLAIGSPVLGIGPETLPTIKRIADHGAGLTLRHPSQESFNRCVVDIVRRRTELGELARRARDVAFTHFNIEAMRQKLRDACNLAVANYRTGESARVEIAARLSQGFETVFADEEPIAVEATASAPPSPAPAPTPEARPGKTPAPPRPAAPKAPRKSFASMANPETEETTPDAPPPEAPTPPAKPATPKRSSRGSWLSAGGDAATPASSGSGETLTAEKASPAPAPAEPAEPAAAPAARAVPSGVHVKRCNGAGVSRKKDSGEFRVYRHAAAVSDHAEIRPDAPGHLAGLRVHVSDVQGRAQFVVEGRVVLSVHKPGAYNIVLDRKKLFHGFQIRCLERMDASVAVQQVEYLAE